MKSKKVLVTGSLAYDHIMDFPGHFAEHILPDKIHILNVSFLVDTLKKQWGGTAGNIAYNLALLREKPAVLAVAGRDFKPYRTRLERAGVDVSQIKEYPNDLTPTFFVMTDKSDNQIAGFYLGVMKQASKLSINQTKCKYDLVIISPNDPKAMVSLSRQCQKQKIPFIFDPGQQIPRLGCRDIIKCINGAKVVIGNDYEVELILRKTGLSVQELLKMVEALVITKGDRGSQIMTLKEEFSIPKVAARRAIDPTGAGDAYRAGLIKGILDGLSWTECGRLGALAAVYAVEKYGTQEHHYTTAEFKARYEKNFGEFPNIAI